MTKNTDDTYKDRTITLMSHLFASSVITELEDLSKKHTDRIDFEADLLSNKYTCPNDHDLIITICSCAPYDMLHRKFVFRCQDDCEYNKIVGLDCGNSDCSIYSEDD